MRKSLLLLLPLLLTACVDDSASYYADGKGGQHSLTVRRVQPYIWKDEVEVQLTMSRQPECQRRVDLQLSGADEIEIELYAKGDNMWVLRSGQEAWAADTQTCVLYTDIKTDPGELVGMYHVDGDKLIFEAAVAVGPDGKPLPTPGGQVSN